MFFGAFTRPIARDARSREDDDVRIRDRELKRERAKRELTNINDDERVRRAKASIAMAIACAAIVGVEHAIGAPRAARLMLAPCAFLCFGYAASAREGV